MSISRVGFLGLGTMGTPMAKNLKKKGFEVVVWNRTPARAEALKADGIAGRRDARPSWRSKVDAFCTCVADPAALEGVAAGLLRDARARASSSSTSPPSRCR